LEERKALLEAWVEAAPGMTIISHVGSESIVDAIALASHAKSLDGVASIAAMPPTFFRPSSVSELVAWFSPIAEAAYPLTIKYYHIPSMTNVALDMDEFLVAASSAIPNFTGIKYTDTDLYTFTKCVSEGVGEMFYGKDETLTSGMLLGATSAVGSTYSFLAPTAWSAVHAWESGNVKSAQEYQGKITLLINTMLPYGGIPAQKAIVKMMGLDLGNVRLPLKALEEDQEANLKKDLQVGLHAHFTLSDRPTNIIHTPPLPSHF
jgi:N-acetylneuraminate lyase